MPNLGIKHFQTVLLVSLATVYSAMADKPLSAADVDAVRDTDASSKIVLKAGESCEIIFDRLEYKRKHSALPQVSLILHKGMSDLEPGQYFTFQAYSNTFDEKPFLVGGAPCQSSSMVSESNGNAWQDRQGALRITAVSGTIAFSNIEVTVNTGKETYSSNICITGKTKINKGVDVSKTKIPKKLKLSPRWCGKPLKLPVHSYVRKSVEEKCYCELCKETNTSLLLDQKQTDYSAGLGARAHAGRGFWQSFMPSVNGTLERIDLAFFGDMIGQGVLTVYSGEGIAGKKLYSSKVRVTANDNAIWNSYTMTLPVLAQKKYTFHFTPNPEKMPDPYGVCAGNAKVKTPQDSKTSKLLYDRGVFATIDPSGEYKSDTMSAVFRTYVRPEK